MLDNYRDLIDELLGGPSAVRAMVEAAAVPLPSEAARLIAEGRDRDRVVLRRLQAFMAGGEPVLPPLAAEAPPTVDEDATSLLTGMDQARGDLVSLLMNLTLRDWERTAIGEDGDLVSLADEVERHVEFDEEHQARIRALLGRG